MTTENKYKIFLTMVVGFLVLHWLLEVQILFYVAIGLGVISIVSSYLGDKIVWLWLKLAHGLGWFNSRVLLSLIYFLVLVPFSWFYKLTTKNPLGIRKVLDSTYLERNHIYGPPDLKNSW